MDAFWAALIPSVAVIVSAVITSRGQNRTHNVVEDVRSSVTTTNGQSIAEIIEAGEERRTSGDAKTS